MKNLYAWFQKPDKSLFEQLIEAIVVVVPIAFLIRTFIFGLYIVPSGSMEHTLLVGERFVADKLTPWFRPIERGEIIALNSPRYQYSTNTFKNLFERYIWGPENWTKRVIGIPGDHVKGVIEDGKPVVYLNGKKLDEPYVNKFPLIYLWKKRVPTVQDLYLGNVGVDVRTFDPSKPYDQQPFYMIDSDLVVRLKERYLADAFYNPELNCCLSMPDVPLANGDDVFDVKLGPDEYWLMGDNRKGSADSRDFGKVKRELIHGRIVFRFFSIQYVKPWSFLMFDESNWVTDLILHPISFWQRVRWSRCFEWVK